MIHKNYDPTIHEISRTLGQKERGTINIITACQYVLSMLPGTPVEAHKQASWGKQLGSVQTIKQKG